MGFSFPKITGMVKSISKKVSFRCPAKLVGIFFTLRRACGWKPKPTAYHAIHASERIGVYGEHKKKVFPELLKIIANMPAGEMEKFLVHNSPKPNGRS